MTSIERTTLRPYADEPTRRIGIRVERPGGDVSGPSPLAVLLHGFKGFMDWGFFPLLSRRFAERGFVCVSMNASGCGVGDDPLEMDDEEAFFRDTYSRQLEDIAHTRAFARELDGVDAERETLFGHSRGGGMAVLAAADDPPSKLVTWAAIDDVDRTDDDAKRLWREEGELRVPNGRTGQIHRISLAMLLDYERDPSRFDVVAAAGRVNAPFLALHGSNDETVDPRAAERLSNAAPNGDSRVLDGANHGMNAMHPLDLDDVPNELDQAIDVTISFAAN